MNIQIYGRRKSFDTQKAQRYFKERRISFQYIDIEAYPPTPRVHQLFKQKLGLDALIDKDCREYEDYFVGYQSSQEAVEEKLLAHPRLYAAPIVRNGNEVTVGYHPEIWKNWQ